jgi:RimJ/RimL family protein N-acetyltransferase
MVHARPVVVLVMEGFEVDWAAAGGDVILRDGGRFRIRPVRPSDRTLLLEAFERMSPRSRYQRFFTPVHDLGEPLLRSLTEVDYLERFAWVALACEGNREALAGVARYIRLPDDPTTAELALTVVDPYQGRGIGHVLLDALVLAAVEAGLSRFEGEILGENAAIRAVLADTGARLERGTFNAVHFAFDLAPRARALRAHPDYELLHRLAIGAPGPPGTACEALTPY